MEISVGSLIFLDCCPCPFGERVLLALKQSCGNISASMPVRRRSMPVRRRRFQWGIAEWKNYLESLKNEKLCASCTATYWLKIYLTRQGFQRFPAKGQGLIWDAKRVKWTNIN